MSDSSFATAILTAFGLWGLVATATLAVGWRFVARWLNRRIEAGVEHGLSVRLAEHQHGLDKQLEDYRSALEADRQRLRSSLDKSIADYRLYAERRANAVSELFAAMLAAELKTTDRSMFSIPELGALTPEALDRLLGRLRVEAPVAQRIRDAIQAGGSADAMIRDAAHALKYRLAMDAREDAHEAYYRSVLYLPASVDQAALSVRDYFHEIAVDHSVADARGPNYVQHKTHLRFLMLELQNASRRELGASAHDLRSGN